MRLRLGLLAGSCAAVLIAGCSSGGSNSAISRSGSATLQSDVLALTRGAAAHEWAAADSALSELRSDLAEALANGSVDAERGRQIRATITAVATDLAARRGTASSTPPATSASKAPTTKASSPTPHRTSSTAPKPPTGGTGDKGHGKKRKHG